MVVGHSYHYFLWLSHSKRQNMAKCPNDTCFWAYVLYTPLGHYPNLSLNGYVQWSSGQAPWLTSKLFGKKCRCTNISLPYLDVLFVLLFVRLLSTPSVLDLGSPILESFMIIKISRKCTLSSVTGNCQVKVLLKLIFSSYY